MKVVFRNSIILSKQLFLLGSRNSQFRGSQYCAYDYQKILKQFGMVSSMSRRGNCYDNAPIESFWGTLKNELVHHKKYLTREEAKQDITEYIEIFYNRQRKQARLGYLYPCCFYTAALSKTASRLTLSTPLLTTYLSKPKRYLSRQNYYPL